MKRVGAGLVALALLAALGGPGPARAAGPKVYVGLFKDDAVAVIDTAQNRVVSTIAVPKGPHGLVITPDGRKVYVSSDGASTVSVIDTATDKVVASIDVGANPHGLAMPWIASTVSSPPSGRPTCRCPGPGYSATIPRSSAPSSTSWAPRSASTPPFPRRWSSPSPPPSATTPPVCAPSIPPRRLLILHGRTSTRAERYTREPRATLRREGAGSGADVASSPPLFSDQFDSGRPMGPLASANSGSPLGNFRPADPRALRENPPRFFLDRHAAEDEPVAAAAQPPRHRGSG